MVQNDLLKLEMKRLRDLLTIKRDELFSLENRRQQLIFSMEERKHEIAAHRCTSHYTVTSNKQCSEGSMGSLRQRLLFCVALSSVHTPRVYGKRLLTPYIPCVVYVCVWQGHAAGTPPCG